MHPSLTNTKQAVFWVDQLTHASEERPSLVQNETADLVVIGGGFTGLWTALIASETNPGRKIVL
ncbi:MAG: FAD-dependent oxidoreductase, partial [Acidimicrobiaceae bacterium]|nr:FAD-dependent oxidoreductase [Acidimicrobiaceae bacterium]